MAQGENLNVFSGVDSISQYFDPDNLPLLPLVEVPSKLNPFRDENVRIYAKMLTAHPAHNVKALPGNGDPFFRMSLISEWTYRFDSAKHAARRTFYSLQIDS